MSHFQPHSVVSCSPSLLQQPPQSVLTPLSNSGNLVLGIGTWTVGWKKWRSWKATRKLSIVSRISCSWQSTTKHQITGCWFISVGWAGNHMVCGWEWPGQVRIWPAALCHISLSLFPINLHCICLIKQKKKKVYTYIYKNPIRSLMWWMSEPYDCKNKKASAFGQQNECRKLNEW